MVGAAKYGFKSLTEYGLAVTGFLLLLSVVPSYSQLSHGGYPAKIDEKTISEIPVVRMPGIDRREITAREEDQTGRVLKRLVFARKFILDIDPRYDGKWQFNDDGSSLWRIAIHSPGAFSLNMIFDKFLLEPGVSVFLYDPGQSEILGAFDHRNNQSSGSLATAPVTGDMLIVEMQVSNQDNHYGELRIGSLNHDFTGITGLKSGDFGRSGKCNIDINCPPGNPWQRQNPSVLKILVDGITLCSGVLVNNTTNDGKPYFLTANHCISDSTEASNTVFIFNYESPSCNGGNSLESTTLSGADLLATQSNLDFTLVEIRDVPPIEMRPWYSGWSRSEQAPQGAVSIHHPNGDVKKIAIDNDVPSTATFGEGYTPNGHWKIDRWDLGTTENGSSGSPLFDNDGRITGILTGGKARCGNSVNDYYCKFSLAWDRYDGINNQLKPWLDPLGTGVMQHDGLNPYSSNDLAADFTFNSNEICIGDLVVFTDFSTGDISSWQWDFGPDAVPSGASDMGPHEVRYSTGGEKYVSLTVEGNGISVAKDTTVTLTVKSTDLPTAGFSYTVDGLSVQFLDASENAVSYYWEFGDTRTSTLRNPSNNYSSQGEYTVKQLIRNRACSDTSEQAIQINIVNYLAEPANEGLKVYPVPADRLIMIDFPPENHGASAVNLYSIAGQIILKKTIQEGRESCTINVAGLPPGVYILTISSAKGTNTRKITISR